jgi:hypothetical protein
VRATSIVGAMTSCRDGGGSKHLWNVGQFLPDYTEQHPTRQSCCRWQLSEYVSRQVV